MLPAISPAERTAMITNAQAAMAPEAFDFLIDDARRLGPPDRSSPSFAGRRVTDTRSAGREGSRPS
jgi:hypothetical protein